MGGLFQAPAVLFTENEIVVSVKFKDGWAPMSVRTLWKSDNMLPFLEIEPRFLGRPAPNLVTISTKLPRLYEYDDITLMRDVTCVLFS